MTDQRFIIKMGMGRGDTVNEAVAHGLMDAESHSTLHLLGKLDGLQTQMRLQITLGVPDPDSVDSAAVAAQFSPVPTKVSVVHGGLASTDPDTGAVVLLAAVAVEAFLPPQPATGPAA